MPVHERSPEWFLAHGIILASDGTLTAARVSTATAALERARDSAQAPWIRSAASYHLARVGLTPRDSPETRRHLEAAIAADPGGRWADLARLRRIEEQLKELPAGDAEVVMTRSLAAVAEIRDPGLRSAAWLAIGEAGVTNRRGLDHARRALQLAEESGVESGKLWQKIVLQRAAVAEIMGLADEAVAHYERFLAEVPRDMRRHTIAVKAAALREGRRWP